MNMLIHFRRGVKQIIEFLQVHLPKEGLHPQANKAKSPLNCFDSSGVIQKKPPAKITLSELHAQMERELQAIEQLIRS